MFGYILGFLNAIFMSSENRAIKSANEQSTVYINFSRFLASTLVLGILATTFSAWAMPDRKVLIIIAISLLVEHVVMYTLVRAFKIGEQSIVGPIFGTSIVFLVPLEIIFLGETFGGFGIIGALLVVAGVMVIGWTKGSTVKGVLSKLLKTKGVGLMLIAAIGAAIAVTLARSGLQDFNPLVFGFFIMLGLTLTHLPIVIIRLLSRSWKFSVPVTWAALFHGAGQVCHYVGLSLIPGAYYISFKRLAVVFDVLFGKVFGKEGDFMKRLGGAVIILVGVVMILLTG